MSSESALVYEMMNELRAAGAYVEKNHGSLFSTGRPDLEGCYCGQHFGIEAKVPGGRLTALQFYVLTEILYAGGQAYVLDSLEQLRKVVSEWKRLLQRPRSSLND